MNYNSDHYNSKYSLEDIKRLANPEIVGPGVWFSIHLLAKNASTIAKKDHFIDYMKQLSLDFPCMKCRTHIQAYLKDNPFEPYYTILNEEGDDIGLFKWSWAFHNTVNNRLGKPYMEFQTAWDMYSDDSDMVCSQDCGSNVESEDNEILKVNYVDSQDEDSYAEEDEVISIVGGISDNKNNYMAQRSIDNYSHNLVKNYLSRHQ